MSKKTTCGFRFQGHYIYRQYYPETNRYKILVWVKSSQCREGSAADFAFCGDSHKECMYRLKVWLELNKDWVNKTDGNT